MVRANHHVPCGCDINEGGGHWEGLQKPDGKRDVVLDGFVPHGDGAVKLQQEGLTAIVVGKRGRVDLEE